MKLFDERVLMLVVHRDDECLSAGGTLLQCKDLYLHYYNDTHPSVPASIYDAEAEAVEQRLFCSVSYSPFKKVNHLDDFPISDLIAELEGIINTIRPHTVIIPARSYNQDHRVMHEVALTAMRVHDRNFYVPNILIAEQPETSTPAYTEFIPHVYVPIDIEEKIALFQLYKSQQRSHRSTGHLRYIAGVRGMQCGHPFAEAFQVIRITNE